MGWFTSKSDEHVCSGCGRYFPKSVLTYLYSRFEEVEGNYCTNCIHKAIKRKDQLIAEIEKVSVIKNCDDCGDEYALCFLWSSPDGYLLCERCYEVEKNEALRRYGR